jgi:hypothetical protein
MFVSTFRPLTSCVFVCSLPLEGGKPVACEWDDVNQGEAYAHTLAAFQLVCERGGGGGGKIVFEICTGVNADHQKVKTRLLDLYLRNLFQAFPEFKSNPLYLTGESYFGQYGPNIANWIVNNKPFDTELNLKGK